MLSDLWTRGQILASVRRELMDPSGTLSWSWSDTELRDYIGAWQDYLQEKFEFAWGTATVTTGSSTMTLTAIATDMNRVGNVWWNSYRLGGRSKEELDIEQRDWRASNAGSPEVAYQDDIRTVSVWPFPATTGTGVFEYPRTLTFASDSTPMAIPAWTKYSAINYVVMRAYQRPGANQDLAKAQRRGMRFDAQVKRFQTIKEQCLPAHYPSLRPGGRYEGDVLSLGKANTLFQTWA